jgi:hypothetical protein
MIRVFLKPDQIIPVIISSNGFPSQLRICSACWTIGVQLAFAHNYREQKTFGNEEYCLVGYSAV